MNIAIAGITAALCGMAVHQKDWKWVGIFAAACFANIACAIYL